MKKRVVAFVVMLAMLVTLSSPVFSTEDSAPQIKNVIYLIPDGGGYGLYDFANMVKEAGGFDTTKYPNKTPTEQGPMTMRSYLAGSMHTTPVGGGVTDSSAAGTAMATGYKTKNNRIGIDPEYKPLANLVEAAQSLGKATGLISTKPWIDATPAAFSAHATDRNDTYNIYQQIENQGIEVILGTGFGNVSKYATIQDARDRGYKIINNKSELKGVKPGEKIWGNVSEKTMPYDINLSATQPTLAEMTEAAITSLSADEDGFFLMVEGGSVDTGGHSNHAVVTTSEYLAFDAAFKVAVDFAKERTDTVVLCAPDHDTGGIVISGDMSAEVASVQSGTNPTNITWSTGSHTGEDVGVWMYVPEGVSVVPGLNNNLGDTPSTRTDYVVENNALGLYVADLFGVDMDALSDELFVDVTGIGKLVDNKFTFCSGDKYVYVNKSVYCKDEILYSMDGKVAVSINGKMYVPAEIIDEEDWNYTDDSIGGLGSESSPYIIANETNFIEFTNAIMEGENYSGKYFKQTADLDLSGYSEYTGMGSAYEFAGEYDGDGHTINISLSTQDQCIFPTVSGTILNLGTTGALSASTSNGYAAGIARSLSAGGKVVNCYSTITLSGNLVAGITCANYGTVANSYFAGKLTKYSFGFPMASTKSGGKYNNCYYLSTCGRTQGDTGIIEVTPEVASSTLAASLESGRQAAAAQALIDESKLLFWEQNSGALPKLVHKEATVTGVTVTPDTATVKKGSSLQLTAVVTGENSPNQGVVWSIEPDSSHAGTYITETGKLYIDKDEDQASFIVLAKSKMDGGIAGHCIVTIDTGN